MLVEPKTEFEVTEQGATLLLLGVPQGTRIGIDAQVIIAGPDVKGVKCIPPGPHFVYNISAKRSGGDFSPVVGFFIYSITSDVIIRRWNQEEGLASLSEDEEEKYFNAVRSSEFDYQLCPYLEAHYGTWKQLSNYINRATIERIESVGGEIGIEFCKKVLKDFPKIKAKKDFTNQPRDRKLLLSADVSGRQRCYYTSFSCFHDNQGTQLLDTVIAKCYGGCEDLFLGEMQFAFVAFLMGQSPEAFMQWKSMITLLLSCTEAELNEIMQQIRERAKPSLIKNFLLHSLICHLVSSKRSCLFTEFVKVIYYQLLYGLPQGVDTEEEKGEINLLDNSFLTSDNFLHHFLKDFFSLVHDLSSVDRDLVTWTRRVTELIEDAMGCAFWKETVETSLPATSSVKNLLLPGSVNETQMSHCHKSNSSMEGNHLYLLTLVDTGLLTEVTFNAGSGRYSHRSDSTTLLKSNISLVSEETGIIASETSSVPNICDRDELPEQLSNTMYGSSLSAFVKVESEDVDNNVVCGKIYGGSHTIKSEVKMSLEYEGEDYLDHVPFIERIRLLRISQNNERKHGFHKENTFSVDSMSGSGQPSKAVRIRKRKKTATVSAQTALQEDAPGLLMVLIEKGVLIDDIQLYDGQMDADDMVDNALPEESFSELENVMSKIFTRNASLLRLAPMRFAKGSKTTYCLECLMALVEQAKYLKLRKWPVEWGWCRDIQSFIFVFERQNRIVLERPEYGYATYFFETMASLSISWQIKRLIISMKLTSCRLNILENKILQVGKELTEGEAQVLMQYGWMPNTGLGTMLNYCDRVYHDRKTEKYYSSDWRTKIGKLLVAGYNGGSMVSKTYLGELHDAECVDAKDSSIKLEVSTQL